jgi:ABC-type antimicrobial peptide transport system permease subunit
LLAAIGIYGVIGYSVARRTHEIGIRIVLGVDRRNIMKLIVGQGMVLVLIGTGLGLVLAFALTRVVKSLPWKQSRVTYNRAVHIQVTA